MESDNIPATVLARMSEGARYGSGIGPGWTDLVQQLDNDLNEINPDYVVCQVKEKLGALRYYVEYDGSPEVAELIMAAEAESLTICEECGGAGTLHTEGWWITMCDGCYARLQEIKEARMQEWLDTDDDL